MYQRPHDVDETSGQSDQRVDGRPFFIAFTLAELTGRAFALGVREQRRPATLGVAVARGFSAVVSVEVVL